MFVRYLTNSKLHTRNIHVHYVWQAEDFISFARKKAFTYNTAVHFIFLFVKWQIEIESACRKCSAQKTHTRI